MILNKKLFLGVFFLLFSACSIDSENNSKYIENESNISHLQHSTVALVYSEQKRIKKAPGKVAKSYCSAFFVSPRKLVTALHCIDRNKKIIASAKLESNVVAIILDNNKSGKIIGKEVQLLKYDDYYNFLKKYNGTGSVKKQKAKVVKIDFINDIAILSLNEDEQHSNHWLDLKYKVPQPGKSVYSMGMPRNLFWTLTEGLVSKHGKNSQGAPLIIHQSPLAPGSSGGPLIDDYGFVVGVNVGFFSKVNYLSVAIPTLIVVKLISSKDLYIEVTMSELLFPVSG